VSKQPSLTLPGTVARIITSPTPNEPAIAQITVEDGDQLTEIHIVNTLQNENGDDVNLKPGAHVEVTVAAKA
jgi:hypothetical protein